MPQLFTRFRPFQRYAIASLLVALLLGGFAQWMARGQTYGLPVRTADSFVDSIGVATHLRYLDTAYGRYADVIKPRLQELGVRHIRDGGKDPLFFQKLNDLAKLGIKATLVMDPRDGITPSNVVAEVINPVLSAIAAVEGPNEWDVQRQLVYNGQPFPEGVRQYQTELYTAIKQNPTTTALPVLMPSLAIPYNAPQLGYLPALDAGNMHSYAGGNLPSQGLDTKWIPLTKQVTGDQKSIVATEAGWHTALTDTNASQPGVSENAYARYVPRLFLEYFNRNIQRAFIYELIDERPAPNQENNFGLLHVNGTPKLAFNAIKNLIALLKDPGVNFQPQSLAYQLNGNLSNIRLTLLQKRDRRFYLILWQDVPSFNLFTRTDIAVPEQSITVSLQTPIKQAIAYLPLNSLAPVLQQSNPKSLQVRVPDHPLVIELTPT